MIARTDIIPIAPDIVLRPGLPTFSSRMPAVHPAFRRCHIALPFHQTVTDLSCIALETERPRAGVCPACSGGVTIVTANTAENIEKSQPVADASVLSAVKWDDSKMVTHFANVVNIQSTLEQVDLFFGTNQTWNVPSDRRVQVELNNRIILSPHAAKRLWLALGGVLEGYENRHGELRVEGR
jgi:hypothetical protein